MVSEKATLVNPQGLHMRPAGLFASTMGKYACDVTVVTPEKEVNGKSPKIGRASCRERVSSPV